MGYSRWLFGYLGGAVVGFCTAVFLCSPAVCLAQAPVDAFEVASVKILPESGRGPASLSPPGSQTFSAKHVPMMVLIQLAFGIDYDQIRPGKWVGSDQYDVVAKAPGEQPVSADHLRAMLRSLLRERFHFASHTETKVVSGYALLISKDGPKLKPADPNSASTSVHYPAGLFGPRLDMDGLASMLSGALQTPVVNETALAGQYLIRLEYAPIGKESETQNLSRPSIFNAIQEQLGLRLVGRKVNYETLVVDHCERIPTEN